MRGNNIIINSANAAEDTQRSAAPSASPSQGILTAATLHQTTSTPETQPNILQRTTSAMLRNPITSPIIRTGVRTAVGFAQAGRAGLATPTGAVIIGGLVLLSLLRGTRGDPLPTESGVNPSTDFGSSGNSDTDAQFLDNYEITSTATTYEGACSKGSRDSPVKRISTAEEFNAVERCTNYELSQDIHVTPTERISVKNFAGKFNGNGHKVTGNSHCLFNELEGHVSNLHIANANIINDNSDDPAPKGAIACSVEVGGAISNSSVSDSFIQTLTNQSPVGGIAGSSAGDISRCSVKNSLLQSEGMSSYAGGFVGENNGHIVGGEAIFNIIGTYGPDASAGGAVGQNTGGGLVSDVSVFTSNIKTKGDSNQVHTSQDADVSLSIGGNYAGGVIGNHHRGIAHNLVSQENSVKTKASFAHAGGVIGQQGHKACSQELYTQNAEVETRGNYAYAGDTIGHNVGRVSPAIIHNSRVTTYGQVANADDENPQEDRTGEMATAVALTAVSTAALAFLTREYIHGWQDGEVGLYLATRPLRTLTGDRICFGTRPQQPSAAAARNVIDGAPDEAIEMQETHSLLTSHPEPTDLNEEVDNKPPSV